MILTHEEAKRLRDDYMTDPFELIREVEEAVLEKLAQGVEMPKAVAYEVHAAMCEPRLSYSKGGIKSLLVKLYTAEQLQTAIAAAWVAGYYQAGYTYDGAYADKMSDEFAAEWCKKAAIEGALK